MRTTTSIKKKSSETVKSSIPDKPKQVEPIPAKNVKPSAPSKETSQKKPAEVREDKPKAKAKSETRKPESVNSKPEQTKEKEESITRSRGGTLSGSAPARNLGNKTYTAAEKEIVSPEDFEKQLAQEARERKRENHKREQEVLKKQKKKPTDSLNVSTSVLPSRAKKSALLTPDGKPKTPKQKQKPKKDKKKLFLFGGAGAVLVVVAVLLWCFVIPHPPTYDVIKSELLELYETDEKKAIKETTTLDDLTAIKADLDECRSDDAITRQSLEKEIETIESYITDLALVEKMEQSDYDLASEQFQLNLSELQKSIKEYSIPNLGVTLNAELTALQDEYNQYLNIKLELIDVSKDTSRDPEDYVSLIESKVTHTPNKEELTTAISKIKEKHEIMKQMDSEKNKTKLAELKKQSTALQDELDDMLLPKSVSTTEEGAD